MKELVNTSIIDTITNESFLITRFINSGSFGHVYECTNTLGNRYALKYPISNDCKERDTFTNEIKIYNFLNIQNENENTSSSNNKSVYIPSHKIIKTKDGKSLILIELLGKNINEIAILFPKKLLPLRELILLTIKLLTVIKFVHNKGIIHRDIKPENFIFGIENDTTLNNKLYCIDFGLSKMYLNNGIHVENKKIKSFCGTARYAPISAHRHMTQSRKSDLESIFYMIIYLYKGKLPWMNERVKKLEKTEKYKLIQKLKEETPLTRLTNGLPQEFLDAFKYIQELDFYDKPSYSSLKNMFIKLYIKDFGKTGFNLIPKIES
jgi:casein kinase 1